MNKLQQLLKITYGLVPIIAGLDKFTNLLTDWKKYLPATFNDMLPVGPETFMMFVGIIEIVAGILVFIRTMAGAYLVMIWLIAIALTLVIGGHYYDVAVRDIVMAIGSYVLAQLSKKNVLPG